MIQKAIPLESFWTSKNLFQRKKIILHCSESDARRLRCFSSKKNLCSSFAFLLCSPSSLALLSFGPQYLLTISGASFLLITQFVQFTQLYPCATIPDSVCSSRTARQCILPSVTYWQQQDFGGPEEPSVERCPSNWQGTHLPGDKVINNVLYQFVAASCRYWAFR